MDDFEHRSDEELLAATSRRPEAFGAFYRRREARNLQIAPQDRGAGAGIDFGTAEKPYTGVRNDPDGGWPGCA